jgi:hypothetical protein
MHILLIVPALTLLVSPSIAQYPPPLQNTPILVSETGGEVGCIFFDAVERKAIEEFYGHLPTGSAKCNLPTDLKNKLPPTHQGLERANAGNDVVLDILKDIVTK